MDLTDPDLALVHARYPMYGTHLSRLWGKKEWITYVKELLAAVENGTSLAMEASAHAALLRLFSRHGQEFPDYLLRTVNNPDFETVNAAFPAIGEKLIKHWGSKEFGPYMSGLLNNDRGGSRKGFPFEVLMSLNELAQQHNKDYASLAIDLDIWEA